MKKTLLTIFVSTISVLGLQAQNCLYDWQYIVPITIDNSNNENQLSDFQVILEVPTDLLIQNGKMQTNGEDIRFSLDGCCDVLCYNIESGINTDTTIITVKIPTIPALDSMTINMHYGNVNALAENDPDCVYELWDDFNDTTALDTNKWTVNGITATSLTGGVLEFTGTSNWGFINSKKNFTDMILVRDRVLYSGNSGFVLGYTGTLDRFTVRPTGNILGTTHDADINGGNDWFDNSYPGVSPTGTTFAEYSVKASIDSSYIKVFSYCNESQNMCNTTPTSLSQYLGTDFYVGYSSYNTPNTIDWIYVTKGDSITPSYKLKEEILSTCEMPEPETIYELRNNNVNVYPNPTSGNLIFGLDNENRKITSIQLMDVSGRVVRNRVIKTYSKSIILDISELEDGLYIYKVLSNNEIIGVGEIIKK